MRNLTLSVFFGFLQLAGTATAHELSTSYSELTVEGAHVRVRLTFNLIDFHQLRLPDNNLDGITTAEELGSDVNTLIETILMNYSVGDPGAPVSVTTAGHELSADGVLRLNVLYTFSHDVTDLTVASTLDKLTQTDHRHLLVVKDALGEFRQAIVDASEPIAKLDLDGPTFFENARNFLVLGLEHIVTGYDHLAFLMGLLLMTTTLMALVKVVTAFTVAHSITLALATFELVSLPPRLIESLIALSIAYVAIENFMGQTLVHRWKVTFLFGLVHGFGFSNILREMELTRGTLATSLFSFNLGVELGQLIFVAGAFPLVYLVTASRWKEHVLSGSSLVIMSLGFYWFVQRAFFP